MKHLEDELTEALAALAVINALRSIVNCPVCMTVVLVKLLATTFSAMKELDSEVIDEALFNNIKSELALQTEVRADLKEVLDEFESESNQDSCKRH